MTLAPFALRTAAALGADLRAGRLDVCDVVEETLAAIASHPDQSIFIETTGARAREEALAARKRLRSGFPLGPLDGVPVAWKDLFDVQGRVTTAGSVVLKSEPPAPRDAALLAAASRAGLIAVGLVNMSEFAYSAIGLNPHYGTPRNPNDAKSHRAPGGSSSGSGVVVAAGLAPLAIGTDTGGSVRIPASFNGVVGYKASTGRFPMEGVFPLSRTLDTPGPLAKTVEDCVLADAALRGAVAPEARRGRIEDLHILVPQTLVFDECQSAVVANFEAAIERLARAGARIERRRLPQLAAVVDLIARRGHLVGPEAMHVHGARVFGPQAERIDRRVVKRINLAKDMTAVDLVEVLQSRMRLIAEADAEIGDAIVAFPTTPHVAMPIAALEADDDLFARENLKTARNTMVGNFLDWCGVAMPSGYDAEGMPTSLLLSARHGRDTDALSAALTVEALVRAAGA
jgi:aspartyl-tRNA(Asn)/glutamyl-tRNA(Gln) amidotransferase subunit A